MQIKDLKPRMGDVDIVVDVTEISDAKEFSKFGKPGRVATASARDETGSIKLSLWNEQIDQVSVGDKVHIKNGYVNEWQGEMQLTSGRLGSIEIVGEGKKPEKGKKEESKKEKPKKGKTPAKKEPEKEEEKKEDEWITPEEREEDFDEDSEEDVDVDEEDIS